MKVRKIVGALLAAAEGRLTEKDVYEMLTIPSYGSWPCTVAFTAPGRGLFLTSVEYEDPEAVNGATTADDNLDSQCEFINTNANSIRA